MFSGADTEWLPALGVSWQIPQVDTIVWGPVKLFGKVVPFKPPTPVIVNVLELKISCPRAIACREGAATFFHASKVLKILVLKLKGTGFAGSSPTGSLIPM